MILVMVEPKTTIALPKITAIAIIADLLLIKALMEAQMEKRKEREQTPTE